MTSNQSSIIIMTDWWLKSDYKFGQQLKSNQITIQFKWSSNLKVRQI